jgi:DNA-binding transcriptional MerR regulator
MAAISIPKIRKINEENAMDQKQELQKKLEEIDKQIQETEKQLPAHSVKPPLMHELFGLEDQREAIVAQLKELEAR